MGYLAFCLAPNRYSTNDSFSYDILHKHMFGSWFAQCDVIIWETEYPRNYQVRLNFIWEQESLPFLSFSLRKWYELVFSPILQFWMYFYLVYRLIKDSYCLQYAPKEFMFNFISDPRPSCILNPFIRLGITSLWFPPLLFIKSYRFIKIPPCTFILPSHLSTHPHCAQDTTFRPSVL